MPWRACRHQRAFKASAGFRHRRGDARSGFVARGRPSAGSSDLSDRARAVFRRRHAATHPAQADRKDAAYEDSAEQRNLDDSGRAQARAGDPELSEGEAAVIRCDGKRWKIVARLKPGDWTALAATPPAR